MMITISTCQRVWSRFNIENVGEYSVLYLKIDVLLLVEVFDNFRDIFLNNYDLDVACFYTAALVIATLLRYLKEEVFVGFWPQQNMDYMVYLDANNGTHSRGGNYMHDRRGYGWIRKCIEDWNILCRWRWWGGEICVIEVDFEYPREHHDKTHADFPFSLIRLISPVGHNKIVEHRVKYILLYRASSPYSLY